MSSANTNTARWWAIGTFTLYSSLNFLDRQTLAAVAPQIQTEFGLSNQDIGWIVSAFSLSYALCSPLIGLLIDRVGLSIGAILTIAVWSFAGLLTGFVEGFLGLLLCRALLGAAEAGGIPAFAKASATYLAPKERALGTGLNQLGISAGSMGAPVLAAFVTAQYGWRTAFVVAGLLGFLWIPLWRFVESRTPAALPAGSGIKAATPREMLRDSRYWALIAGNILVMTVYSLWTNWTTIFFVKTYGLEQKAANQNYVWIPPLFATAGGLFGGWLVMRWMNAGASVYRARSRALLLGSVIMLTTIAAPYMPGPGWATAAISFSFFWTLVMSANVYALPQDIFGPQRAAFAVASITFGYGLMQTVYAPFVGRLVDRHGFEPVCLFTAGLPFLGWVILHRATRKEQT